MHSLAGATAYIPLAQVRPPGLPRVASQCCSTGNASRHRQHSPTQVLLLGGQTPKVVVAASSREQGSPGEQNGQLDAQAIFEAEQLMRDTEGDMEEEEASELLDEDTLRAAMG